MKQQDSIATTKVERAMQFAKTGVKIGGNYIKHYAKKAVNPSINKSELHEDNAEDIYNTLSKLKGSALKVAQMLSMDQGLLPAAYTKRFQMAQYSAPPLSAPLVIKTFKSTTGKNPLDIFQEFNLNATAAASIGQVHQAKLNGKTLAVKIQYPGIGASIQSDLKIVKPIALRLLSLSEKEMDKYFKEVEEKLLEETDYYLELKRSVEISQACSHLKNVAFPKYYPEYSSDKVITMEWLQGLHLNEFLATKPSQAIRNKIGQALWEFYGFQMHQLRKVHADSHPGNYLFREDGTLGVIDFGCIKEVPESFYFDYYGLVIPNLNKDVDVIARIMKSLEVVFDSDSAQTKKIITEAFMKLTQLLGKPFEDKKFDFGNDAYIESIYAMGEEISKTPEIMRSEQGRGSKHSLYINRTYFGLYSILNQLKAVIDTSDNSWQKAVVVYHTKKD
jgi:predicted unusual protein kinase regulating ubiquinone biosynthesis (AarF/ABC1/UbiB family)